MTICTTSPGRAPRRRRSLPVTTVRRVAAIIAVCASAMFACDRDDPDPDAARPAPPAEPRRSAAGADDLRIMFAEITGASACGKLRNTFRPIGGGPDAPVTGTMWIEECEAFEHGTTVTLQLAGRGWRWVSRSARSAGAEFELQDYVRFTFSVQVRGAIDIAYAPKRRVFTAWFTPSRPPEATFEPIGKVDVDTEDMWSDVVGALASTFSSSPGERAGDKVSTQGRQQLEKQFTQGIAVTIDLCSGHVRTGFGHPEVGDMLGPPASIREQVAVVYPGGLLLHGPLLLPKRGIVVQARGGGALVSELVCAEEAVKLAKASLAGAALPRVRTIASTTVRTRAVLDAPAATSCPVVHVLRPLATTTSGTQVTYQVSELAAHLPPLATCKEPDAPSATEARRGR